MLLLRPIGMTPVRSPGEVPPLRPVAQVDRMFRRREHQRAREQHMRQRARIICRVGRDFGRCAYPVARTNSLNCRLVTGVRSIQESDRR